MALGVGTPLALALALYGRGKLRADVTQPADVPGLVARLTSHPPAAVAPPAPILTGIDFTKTTVSDTVASVAFAEKRVANLTVDPALQRTAQAILASHHIPEASVVLMDVATGKILVYASHVEKGPPRDLAIEAKAPAASVFKIVTASALVETAGLGPEQRECYSGGEQRILERDLQPDPKRDRWCTTLAGAMGRSINTVFARNALQLLKPAQLEAEARALGYGSSLPFDVPVEASALNVPTDPLGFARTSAGFWNTTLSPLHAAWLTAAIARGGEPVRPVLVSNVLEQGSPKPVYTAETSLAQRRIMKAETAHAVTTMLESTVSDGTSYKAFHDPKGATFLPGIVVAGKTGTLTDATLQRFYTWFAGFAPSKPYVAPEGVKDGEKIPQPRPVSIGVLVVNEPTWQVKANVVAREVLRAYFASQGMPNVTAPRTHDVSAKHSKIAKKK
jgi:peptidoglycan glycosyltransferase